jgi:hypothetical protein
VRISNLDGRCYIKEWLDNPSMPIIDTIWGKDDAPAAAPQPAALKESKAGAGPTKATTK